MVAGTLMNRPVNGFLVDITGVLYNSADGSDGVPIPGSIEAVKRLYKTSKVRFLSNESTNTNEYIVAKLGRLGFDINVKDVITPAPAAAQYVKQHNLKPHVLVHPGVSSYFTPFGPQSEPTCVVLGDAEHEFTFNAVNNAFRALLAMRDPLLVTLGNGKFYQRTDGPTIDVGAYAAALKFSTGCRQVVIGKPSPDYFQAGLDSLGLPKDEVAMIGDDIIGDVGGAQSFGIRGIQVKTGKWRPEWESHEVKPFFIANDLQHAVDVLLKKE